MTEFNETFDIVLYFIRNTMVEPVAPTYESVEEANPNLNMDELLDIYSDILQKHKKDVEKFNKTKHLNKTIESYVFISGDKKFAENVYNFEKNSFFVKWTDASKNTINNIIGELVNVS